MLKSSKFNCTQRISLTYIIPDSKMYFNLNLNTITTLNLHNVSVCYLRFLLADQVHVASAIYVRNVSITLHRNAFMTTLIRNLSPMRKLSVRCTRLVNGTTWGLKGDLSARVEQGQQRPLLCNCFQQFLSIINVLSTIPGDNGILLIVKSRIKLRFNHGIK